MNGVTVKRKPNGKYAVRWRENGRQRQRTIDKKPVADAFALKLMERLQSDGLVDLDRGKVTLAELMAEYVENYAKPNLAATTLDTYIQIWGKHLLPRVGSWPVRDATPKRLRALRTAMERAGAGAPTVLKAFTVLQSLLSYAVVEEHIERNPAREVRKPRQQRTHGIVIAPPEQLEQLRALFAGGWVETRKVDGRTVEVKHPPDPRSAVIVSLLAYGGLRTFSEVHALEWRHVGDRGLQVWASKTRRFDVVSMLPALSQDLAEWRMASGRPDGRRPVIPRRDGAALRETDWRNWRKRTFRPAAEAVGLNGARPYDLRHAFASLLIWEGRSLAEVARQMRHSVMTCSTTYVHVLEEFTPEARVSADERIRAARAGARARRVS